MTTEPDGPVVSTTAEPHGIVECDERVLHPEHPHSWSSDCIDPRPAVWTPGAGVELLRREHPEMVPEVSEEDRAAADRLIAAAEPREPATGGVVDAAFRDWLRDELRDAGCEIRTLSPEGMAEVTVRRLVEQGWHVAPPGPVTLNFREPSAEDMAELKEGFRKAMGGRPVVLPPTEDERERAAYERGKAEHQESLDAARRLATQLGQNVDAAIAKAYADGIEAGRRLGRRQATGAVRAQANLPDLVHFDRPSDFRKGVLSCLAALEARNNEGKPDA